MDYDTKQQAYAQMNQAAAGIVSQRYATDEACAPETALTTLLGRLRNCGGQLGYLNGELSGFLNRIKGPRPELAGENCKNPPSSGLLAEIFITIDDIEQRINAALRSTEQLRDIG